jgi:hypothetical protein
MPSAASYKKFQFKLTHQSNDICNLTPVRKAALFQAHCDQELNSDTQGSNFFCFSLGPFHGGNKFPLTSGVTPMNIDVMSQNYLFLINSFYW